MAIVNKLRRVLERLPADTVPVNMVNKPLVTRNW